MPCLCRFASLLSESNSKAFMDKNYTFFIPRGSDYFKRSNQGVSFHVFCKSESDEYKHQVLRPAALARYIAASAAWSKVSLVLPSFG